MALNADPNVVMMSSKKLKMSLEVVGFSDELEGFESDVDSEAEFSVFEAGQAGDMAAIGETHGNGPSTCGGSPTEQTVESEDSQSQSKSGEASESSS